VATPESIIWRRASDPCAFLAAGYALVLQVSYPTVGSGVRDHSSFDADPWGRLLRTLDYVNLLVYGGDATARVIGRRLRDAHRSFRGTNPDGTRYHALEPDAYAWVQATLVWGMVEAHRYFGHSFRPDETERVYREWLGLSRLVGVRDGDLPGDWRAFTEYVDDVMRNQLVHHESVDRVFRSFRTARAPLPALSPLWPAARCPTGHLLWLTTTGLLPPFLRERFGLGWGLAREAEFFAVATAARTVHNVGEPFVAVPARVLAASYIRWRRRAIVRGPLGPGVPVDRAA
jgi:uncharacterized protein (DUF2236 family)